MKRPNAPMTREEQLREMNEGAAGFLSTPARSSPSRPRRPRAASRESHAKLQEHADELDRFNRVASGASCA